MTGRTFGIDPSRPARFDITKLGPMLEDVHERLARIVIENLPYAEFIRRYDQSSVSCRAFSKGGFPRPHDVPC